MQKLKKRAWRASDTDDIRPNPHNASEPGAVSYAMKKAAVAVVLAVVFVMAVPVVASAEERWNMANVMEAFANLFEETSQRLDASPARMVGLIAESLTNGSTHLSLSAEGGRTDGWLNAAFFSNAQARDFALLFEAQDQSSFFEDSIAFELYLNEERMALGMSLLNYYLQGEYIFGFTFDNVLEEVMAFAQVLGFSPEEILQEIELAREWARAINFAPPEIDLWMVLPYIGIFAEFLSTGEQTVESVELQFPDEVIDVTRKGISFELKAVADLFNNLADRMERDTALRQIFESVPLIGFPRYDWIIEDLRWAAETFLHEEFVEHEELFLSLYLSDNNRLVKAELVFFFTDGVEMEMISIVADFERGANEMWAIAFSDTFQFAGMAEPTTSRTRLTWDMDTQGGAYVHSFSAYEYFSRRGFHTMHRNGAVISWNPVSGVFSITRSTDNVYADVLTGILRADGNGFTSSFAFTNAVRVWRDGGMQWLDETITIELSGVPGVRVPQIDFINIANLDEDFISRLR
ncbi:MAG: hypothetical protein FWF79_02115 [Defluviitaleaceae bacterium]|nr:hypothetical protein [Defluviitaleaceae bacterium]